jgi:hypothetical protein
MIVDELDISKDTIWKIVIEDLKKTGILLMLCTAYIDCRTGGVTKMQHIKV